MKTNQATALMIRMDKIGDLVLSLPADQAQVLHRWQVHWFIAENLEFVPQFSEPPRKFSAFCKKFSLSGFIQMLRTLGRLRPQVAVVFYAPWWVGLALFLARVPVRIGRLSQWHSFLFFNYGVRQKRSQSLIHESEYNWELLLRGLSRWSHKPYSFPHPIPYLKLKAPRPSTTLKKWQLQPQQYIVVHPGMAGSALNWPGSHYLELIQTASQKTTIVITGTKGDASYLQPLQQSLQNQPQVLWLNEALNSEELLDILSQAKAVVAPSTGVLHLAASLGVSAVGLYSPKRQESSRRWGPRGPKAIVLEPFLTHPTDASADFDSQVMSQISVKQVLEALEDFKKIQSLS